MWGEVTPAERLRAVTRRGFVDDEHLAVEAADALAGFATEPASLVVACRRVLAHHRADAPLWWVCARILGAAEPVDAARAAARELESDRTVARLGAALPILDEGEVVAVIGWTEAIDAALVERFDIAAVALRLAAAEPRALRRRAGARRVQLREVHDPRLARVSRLLVRAHAIGRDQALVPVGTGGAIDALGAAVGEVWLVGGVGRVLPGRLFDALVGAVTDPSADDDHDALELLMLARADRVVGPRGVERAADAAARVDCPVVPELLRPLG
jgi:hypothetical protein